MRQTFRVRENEVVELSVVAQMSYNVGAIAYRVSKVRVEDEIKYIYEELTNDEVVTCKYVEPSEVKRNCPWAVTMLPLTPLTKKQEEVLRWVLADEAYEDNTSMIWTEEFKEVVAAGTGVTQKAIEGILSSLWVKGYITMAQVFGKGARYFTLDAFGIEYLKDKEVPVAIERDEEEETDEEE